MSRYFPTLSVWGSKLSVWLWASKRSFFSVAAWYCLVAPFVAAGFGTTIFLKYYQYERWQPQSFPTEYQAISITFFICLSSFLLGIASLFGISRHGIKVILWKAVIGILASCFVGLLAFIDGVGMVAHQ